MNAEAIEKKSEKKSDQKFEGCDAKFMVGYISSFPYDILIPVLGSHCP